MSDTNTTPATEDNRAALEDKGTFTFGGRKRKEGEPFAKIERAVVFANLPEESKRFVIRYGIRQYVSDGAASAKSDADFAAGIDGRIENLANADFSRTTGEGPAPTNDPEVLATTLARQELSESIKAARAADSSFTLTKEQRAAALDAYRKLHAERLVKEATRQIADRKKNATAAGADIMALLTPAA